MQYFTYPYCVCRSRLRLCMTIWQFTLALELTLILPFIPIRNFGAKKKTVQCLSCVLIFSLTLWRRLKTKLPKSKIHSKSPKSYDAWIIIDGVWRKSNLWSTNLGEFFEICFQLLLIIRQRFSGAIFNTSHFRFIFFSRVPTAVVENRSSCSEWKLFFCIARYSDEYDNRFLLMSSVRSLLVLFHSIFQLSAYRTAGTTRTLNNVGLVVLDDDLHLNSDVDPEKPLNCAKLLLFITLHD